MHYAKPGNEKPFQIEYRLNVGWVVLGRDGKVVGDPHETKGGAATIAGVRNREAARKAARAERPCMRCQNKFESEGIHNRLCNHCRQVGSAEAVPCSFGAISGRKRSA